MNSKLVRYLKYPLSFLFAGYLFWLVYRDVDFGQIEEMLAKLDYRWVWLSMLLAIVSHLSRALRWKIALRPLGHNPKTLHAFLTVMAGYFANLLAPRLGEIVRCGMLQRTDSVPVDRSLGAVVTERAIDLLMLGMLTAITLLVEFDRIGGFLTAQFSQNANGIVEKAIALSLLAVGGVLVLMTLWLLRARLKRFALYDKAKGFLLGVQKGLTSIRKLDSVERIKYFMHTLNIWLMYYLMAYVLFFSTEDTASLSPMVGMSALIMGALGMTMPTPGGVGSYHVFVSATFIAYGLSDHVGKNFAFLMHTSQTLLVLFLGGASALVAVVISTNGKKAALPKS